MTNISATDFYNHIAKLRQAAASDREKIYIETFKRIDLLMRESMTAANQYEAYERIKHDRNMSLQNADEKLQSAIEFYALGVEIVED